MVITQKNSDVHLLNAAIRDRLQQSGVISDDEVVVRAKQRGKNGKAVDLTIAVGDRIIFGGNKKQNGQMFVQNNDVGVVQEIRPNPSDVNDPIVSIKFDNGIRRQAAWSEYAGLSQQDYKDTKKSRRRKRVVEAQHAYAVTVYASQGMTVDKSFVYLSGRVQRSLAYVAMTRHRDDMRIYVDQNRFTNSAKKRVEDVGFGLGADGQIRDLADDKAEISSPNIALTDDEKRAVIDRIGSEMNRDSEKRNISDYVADVSAWMARGDTRNIAGFLKQNVSENVSENRAPTRTSVIGQRIKRITSGIGNVEKHRQEQKNGMNVTI